MNQTIESSRQTIILTAPPEPRITAHFQRFEMKYRIPPLVAERIRRELVRSHMQPDPVLERSGKTSYTVSSAYLDSPDWQCFRANGGGERRRFKLRIRTYATSLDPSSLWFLEIKRKDDAVITKDRVAIPASLGASALMKEFDPFALLNHPDVIGEKIVLEEFLWRMGRGAMRPVALISYERLPLVARYYDRFRVTFDSTIRASARTEFFGHDDFMPVERHCVIMEVKFNNVLPNWFHRILQRYELHRDKYSKYVNGVRTLERYHQLNTPQRP